MTRVVSIFFPDLATDRIRRADPSIPLDQAIAVIAKSGSRRWVSAADDAARRAGVTPGMPAAKAQAIFRDLKLVDADPVGDQLALKRIALWALSIYSPVVAVDGNDGIVMNTEGADHLQGGEQKMLSRVASQFKAKGLNARVAIADTWGAAHACARSIRRETVIVGRGELFHAVARLPVALLRLAPKIVADLGTLGFRTIGELSATARAPLALRFGPEVGRRLDQMFGRISEPIEPIREADRIDVSRAFAEPIAAAETINKYVGRLIQQLIGELQRRGLGARKIDLIVEKTDGTLQAIRAGTAKPARDEAWLTKLFKDRTEKIEPGFGIEKLTLIAVVTEPLQEQQKTSSLVEEAAADIAPLIDILGNRGQRVYRIAPVASDVPERSVRRIAHAGDDIRGTWDGHWRRPIRLLHQPDEIKALSLMPDYPPRSITWRGRQHNVRKADGPERVFGEWWTCESELEAVRDYYVVENEMGERYWIFRSGDGVDPETGDRKWFMHGIFG
ncbi:Y-family DNA polymerase [Rhizobium sp. Rhizsp82]|uniref:Y-family DNA polymerase n=1 Tax=Rhizobium sp. Rhizsp82 TaxID=3243057 RepID=UPI0039B551A3